MDIGKAFSFVFEDEDWITKALIGAVLALTGIGFIPIIGYGMEVARRVVNEHPQPLPEWDNWGTKIIEGLLSGLVGFVWSLPPIIITGCILAVVLPVANVGESGEVAAILVMVLSLCVGLFAILYGLALAFILPAAMVHYAITGELGAAFRFGEIIAMVRENLGTYLMVLVATLLAQLVAGLGSVALGCGVFFTAFYSFPVMYHAYGQAYRIAAGNVQSSPEFQY